MLIDTKPLAGIQIPDFVQRRAETRGAPLKTLKGTVHALGPRDRWAWEGIYPGDTLIVIDDAPCLTLDHSDYPDDIPEGFEMRIYGAYERWDQAVAWKVA